MPELPEVETVRAGIAATTLGRQVQRVTILDARSVRRQPAGWEAFSAELQGQRIESVHRRGKFLWLPLAADRALVCHLGMSGQVLVRTPQEAKDPQQRIELILGVNAKPELSMRFIDQRLFGGMHIEQLVPTPDSGPGGYSPEAPSDPRIPESVAHIARDLLDPLFDPSHVVSQLLRKQTGIKRALLDQNLMSGVGNIYADESLWRARLHYDQPAASISKRKLTELIAIVQEVLQAAVTAGGTSFDEQYKNVNGESGYFSVALEAYGREGEACSRCGSQIVRKAWANRGSHFCPRCQRLRRAKLEYSTRKG